MGDGDDELVATYRQTIRPLYAYVSRRVGGDAALAEDLVQDTWMRALDAWPARGVPHEPLAWLIRVAHNTLVSHFRRMRPELVDPSVLDLAADFTPDGPENAAAIGWGLARLRRAHAEVLEAFYFDGKSVREIAGECGTSERAIEGRLRRAGKAQEPTPEGHAALERGTSCSTHTNLVKRLSPSSSER